MYAKNTSLYIATVFFFSTVKDHIVHETTWQYDVMNDVTDFLNQQTIK